MRLGESRKISGSWKSSAATTTSSRRVVSRQDDAAEMQHSPGLFSHFVTLLFPFHRVYNVLPLTTPVHIPSVCITHHYAYPLYSSALPVLSRGFSPLRVITIIHTDIHGYAQFLLFPPSSRRRADTIGFFVFFSLLYHRANVPSNFDRKVKIVSRCQLRRECLLFCGNDKRTGFPMFDANVCFIVIFSPFLSNSVFI